VTVPVGLNVWSRLVEATFPYFDRTVGPFDSVWLPDHVQYNGHKVAEGWTLLTWALARYPDKTCGHEVLCNSFRNPAHTAKMVATAQALSGGRVILGIGAGWNREEYLAYGWPFPPTPVRIAQLGEAIELIRRLWSDSPASYAGEHYRIADAHCEPPPVPIPPIMVGGHGEKHLLRAVARHADWWNYGFTEHDLYAHKQAVLRAHCKEVGRDYDSILRTHVTLPLVMARDRAAVEAKYLRVPERRRTGQASSLKALTPEEGVAYYRGLADAGMQHFVIGLLPDDVETAELVAEQVMPAFN